MVEVSLREARAEDFPAIRALIYRTGINPFGLDWRRFLVAESPDGELIGCGQLKPHADGSLELASLAVVPAWRRRGVARRLIQALLTKAPRPVYLTCLGHLQPFYEKFGFRVVAPEAMSPYFRRLSRLVGLVLKFTNRTLLVMKVD